MDEEESGQNRILKILHEKTQAKKNYEEDEIPESVSEEEAERICEEISISLEAIPNQNIEDAMQLVQYVKKLLKYPVDVSVEIQHFVLSLAFQITHPELQSEMFALAAYLFLTRPTTTAELLKTDEIGELLQMTTELMPKFAFRALVNFIMSGKQVKLGLFEMGIFDSLKTTLESHPSNEHISQILEILSNLLDMPSLDKEYLEKVIEPVVCLVHADTGENVLINSLQLLVTILSGTDSSELYSYIYEKEMDEFLTEKFENVRTFCKYKIVEVFINLSGSTRNNTQILIDRDVYSKLLHFVNTGDETVQSYVLDVMRNLLDMGVEICDALNESGLMEFAIDKLVDGDFTVKRAAAKFMCGLCYYITDSDFVFEFLTENRVVPILVEMLELRKSSTTQAVIGTLRNLAHKAMTDVDELLESPIFADVDEEVFCDALQALLDDPEIPYDTIGKHADYLLGLLSPVEEEDTAFIEQLDC